MAAVSPKQTRVGADVDDPVLLEVVRNYLISTCEEMGAAMMRTSYSTMFNEARDFSCGIFDRTGDMVAMGDFCPAHIGAIVHTVEWAIKEVGPENMDPGDVILHNDPYRGGCHLPEFLTLKPCFHDGDVVAYAANIAHMTDIGGMVPAAFGDTRNIFQEGIRLPPLKIYRRDQAVEDIFNIIASNVRTPEVSRGDLKAMIGSTYLAERRVVELIERYGVDVFNGLAERIKDISELLVRRAISRMPDGEYTAEGYLEDDGVVSDKRYKFVATLVIRGDEIIVDYTGSDPQAQGAINQSFGTTASATYATIFHMIDEGIAKNHGAYRPISIVAPPGTVRKCQLPRVVRRRQFRHLSEYDGPAVRGVCAVQRQEHRGRRGNERVARLLWKLGRQRTSLRAFAHRGKWAGAPAPIPTATTRSLPKTATASTRPARCSRSVIRCESSRTGLPKAVRARASIVAATASNGYGDAWRRLP